MSSWMTSFSSVTFRATNRVSYAWTRVVPRIMTEVAEDRTAGDSIADNDLNTAKTTPLSRAIAVLTALLHLVRGALPLHMDALPAQINVVAAFSLTHNVRPASELVTRLSIVTCWPLPCSLNVTNSPFWMQSVMRSNRNGSLTGRIALVNLPVPYTKSCAPTAMR